MNLFQKEVEVEHRYLILQRSNPLFSKEGEGRFGRNDNEENNQIGHEFLNLHTL